MWVFPHNTVRASGFTFIIDTELQEPIQINIACPCAKDFKPSVKKVRVQKVTGYCSCVLYAKSQTGFSKSITYARNWPIIKGLEPTPNSVVITNESSAGHVGLVTAVTDTTITIREANYKSCALTTRTISRSSPVIRGYWK